MHGLGNFKKTHDEQNKENCFKNSPWVEVLYGYPVRVEVDGEGWDVPHIGVVHQRLEVHRPAVQEIQNLGIENDSH